MRGLKKYIFSVLSIVILLLPGFSARAAVDRSFTLVIDAGHGGHDAGAVGAYSQEKDINLNIALAFGHLVEQYNPNIKVIYTRKTDVFIPLQERANIANRNKADLFISVHTNSLPDGRIAYGSETYTLGMARAGSNLDVAKRENSVILYENDYRQRYSGFDPNSAESYIMFEFMQDQYMKQSVNLATCIQKCYVQNANRKDKGVHQAGFLVLRNTSMPSVLTEVGFISTPEEEDFLNSQDGINSMGRSIYEGFLAYLNKSATKVPSIDKSSIQMANRDFYSDNDDEILDVKIPTPKVLQQPEPAKPAPAPKENKPTPARHKAQKPTQRQESKQKDSTEENTAKPVEKAKPVKVIKKHTPEPTKKAPEQKPEANESNGEVTFKVQIFAVTKRIPSGSPRFKELDKIDCYEEGDLIKYTYGSTSDYKEAQALQKSITEKFPHAFIVAFSGKERIELIKAIRMSRKTK